MEAFESIVAVIDFRKRGLQAHGARRRNRVVLLPDDLRSYAVEEELHYRSLTRQATERQWPGLSSTGR